MYGNREKVLISDCNENGRSDIYRQRVPQEKEINKRGEVCSYVPIWMERKERAGIVKKSNAKR